MPTLPFEEESLVVEKADKSNRGRSDEARDPNRPIDPETGEKEGLGPRTTEGEPTEGEPTEGEPTP